MSDKERMDAEDRNDGFLNVVTGVGTSKDKRIYNQSLWINRDLEFYEQLYSSDELASRLVDTIPENSLRRWINFTSVKSQDVSNIEEKCKELSLRQTFLQAWIWARTYGGSVVYLVSKSGLPQEPMKKGEEIIAAVPLSRYDCRIFSSDVDSDFASPNYSRPNQYFLNIQMGSQYKGYPVHWSRCIRFDGDLLPRRSYIRNNYWHDSVLNKLYNAIRNYQSANDNAASMLQDFNMGVYKMKNLAHLISAGKEDLVKKRLEMLQFSKSTINALILDSEDEEYIDMAKNVTGMKEMLDAQSNRLVAATDIPHTILLGESPDGSGQTGNSTTQQWLSHINSEQENYLRPKLDRAFDIIFSDSKNDFEYKFNNLYELDDQEEADLRAKQAGVDAIYIDRGVLDPEEVSESRFGGDKYSAETTLDKEAREKFGPPQTPNEAGIGEETTENKPELPEEGKNDSFNHVFEENKVAPNEEETYHPFHNQEHLVTNSAVKKKEPLVSISQSTPFTDPKLEEMYWLKETKTKEHVANLDQDSTTKRVATIEVLLDGKMLMGKRRDNGKWTQPGGHIEPNEDPMIGASRELFEETGIAVSPDDLVFVQAKRITTRRNTLDVYHYKVEFNNEAIATTPMNDPDKECHSWDFMSRSELSGITRQLHAPRNIIFQKNGLLKKDEKLDDGESIFFPRQLDQTKKKNKDVKN